jgi:hypothetical protein
VRNGVDGRECILLKKEKKEREKREKGKGKKIIGTPHVGVLTFRGEATWERNKDPHPIQSQ